MNQDIRKITDGAMMLAIMGAVMLMDRQFAGFLSGTFLYLFPLPMVYYSAKYGFKDSLPVLASLFILLFILGTPQSIFYVGFEGVIGVVYGGSVHAGANNRKILMRTILMSVLLEVTAVLVFAAFFGYDIGAELQEYMDIFEQMSSQTGVNMTAIPGFDSLLKNIFFISIIVTGILEGFITHFFSRLLLKRLKMPLPESVPLWAYFPPKWTGYVGIAGFVAFYASISRPLDNQLYQTIMQGLGIMCIFYLAAYGYIGMIVVLPRKWPSMRHLAVVLALLMLFMAAPLMAIIGFLYITTDIHKNVLQGGKTDAAEN